MHTHRIFDLQSAYPETTAGETPPAPPAPEEEPLFEPFPEPNTIPRGWDTSEMR